MQGWKIFCTQKRMHRFLRSRVSDNMKKLLAEMAHRQSSARQD